MRHDCTGLGLLKHSLSKIIVRLLLLTAAKTMKNAA